MPFIPTPQSLQDVVSGKTSAQAAAPIGKTFEGLLRLKIAEKESARELFGILAKSMPGSVAKLIKKNPNLIKSLGSPARIGQESVEIPREGPTDKKDTARVAKGKKPKDPSLKPQKVKLPPLADRVMNSFREIAKDMPANIRSDATGPQFAALVQDAMEKFGPEFFLNTENMKLWIQMHLGDSVENMAVAAMALAANGILDKRDIPSIAESVQVSAFLNEQGTPSPDGQPWDPGSTFLMLRQNPALKVAMLEQRMLDMEKAFQRNQMLDISQLAQAETSLIAVQDHVTNLRADLTEELKNLERAELLATRVGKEGIDPDDPIARLLGDTTTIKNAIANLQTQITDGEAAIVRAKSNLKKFRAQEAARQQGRAAPTVEQPTTDEQAQESLMQGIADEAFTPSP